MVASEETAQEIMKHVADQVVNYKHVRSIRFIPAIPKTPSGKILRRLLREAAKQEIDKNEHIIYGLHHI